MGYRTVNHVPSIYTYAQARQIFDKTEPIRGRDIKPLGQRRDADTYHIRMNNMGDVECVLYKTAVVTFHPDETVTLFTDGWDSVSTHQFIWAITGCATRGSRNKTVIKIADQEYVMSERMKLRYTNEGSRKWEVLTKEEQYDWQLDRKKASAVRHKYKGFIKYLTNALKLRTVEDKGYYYAEFGISEFEETFGVVLDSDRNEKIINKEPYLSIDNKRNAYHMRGFINLMDAQGEDNTAAYYKAMLMLAGRCCNTHSFSTIRLNNPITAVHVNPRSLIDKAHECIYKWHSDEVLVRVKLADGKVPTRRYDTWVNR